MFKRPPKARGLGHLHGLPNGVNPALLEAQTVAEKQSSFIVLFYYASTPDTLFSNNSI